MAHINISIPRRYVVIFQLEVEVSYLCRTRSTTYKGSLYGVRQGCRLMPFRDLSLHSNINEPLFRRKRPQLLLATTNKTYNLSLHFNK
jgi:hypothetical protein